MVPGSACSAHGLILTTVVPCLVDIMVGMYGMLTQYIYFLMADAARRADVNHLLLYLAKACIISDTIILIQAQYYYYSVTVTTL